MSIHQLQGRDPKSCPMLMGLTPTTAHLLDKTLGFLSGNYFPYETCLERVQAKEKSIARVREDRHDTRLWTRGRKVKQRTSNKPRRRTAINVSSFLDSSGFRMAALVFRNAFPKMVRPSCWSLRLVGEPPEIIKATDEVAKDKGESALVVVYRGSKCSRWPSILSGWRGRRTKSRKKAQMACCSGKSLNILGTGSFGE